MGILLTQEQKHVVKEGIKFVNRGHGGLFQFDGGPGTGKSVVLNAIAEGSGVKTSDIAAMAYIGQAAIVMRLKGLYTAKTLHSWLYDTIEEYVKDEDGNVVMDKYLNKPKSKLKFVPKELPPNIRIIFVDEAGSVPETYAKEILSRGIPVIATGDLDQLPPVGGNPYFLNPRDPNLYHLTQIMRQAEGSPIIYLSDRAKRGLTIHPGLYGNNVLVIYDDEITNSMLLGSDAIICGKNATRDSFNSFIRNDLLKIPSKLPVYGDKMVCRKNNWKIEEDGIGLANGLIGYVTNSPSIEGFDGKTIDISFRPHFMNSSFTGVQCDYNYLISPYHKRKIIKEDRFSVGEKFEYAYATTCHSTQGSQFNSGMYVEEYLGRDIQKNLNYTGITRFVNGLIYVKKRKRYY